MTYWKTKGLDSTLILAADLAFNFFNSCLAWFLNKSNLSDDADSIDAT